MQTPDPLDRKKLQGVAIFAQPFDGKTVLCIRQEHIVVRIPLSSARRFADALHDYLDGRDDA